MNTHGLLYSSVAVSHLIPFALSTVGDTSADRNGKGVYYDLKVKITIIYRVI